MNNFKKLMNAFEDGKTLFCREGKDMRCIQLSKFQDGRTVFRGGSGSRLVDNTDWFMSIAEYPEKWEIATVKNEDEMPILNVR